MLVNFLPVILILHFCCTKVVLKSRKFPRKYSGPVIFKNCYVMLLTAQVKLPFWVIQKFLHRLLFQSKKLMIVCRIVAGVIFCFVQSYCIMILKLIPRSFYIKFLMEHGWRQVRIMLSTKVGYVEWGSCRYLPFGKFSCVTWYRAKITSLPGAEHSLHPHILKRGHPIVCAR
jgi:hypothetical protein